MLAGERGTATLVAVLTSQSLFFGAIDVLFVVLAIGELGIGDSGVGILNAAFGAGGLIAVFVTLGLVGRRRLAPSLIAAALIMGGSIALIAVWPRVGLTIVLLAVVEHRSQPVRRVGPHAAAAHRLAGGARPHLRRARKHRHARSRARLDCWCRCWSALGGNTLAIVGVGAIMPLIMLALLPAILRRRRARHRADRPDRPAALDGALPAAAPARSWRESRERWSRCMPPPARR